MFHRSRLPDKLRRVRSCSLEYSSVTRPPRLPGQSRCAALASRMRDSRTPPGHAAPCRVRPIGKARSRRFVLRGPPPGAEMPPRLIATPIGLRQTDRADAASRARSLSHFRRSRSPKISMSRASAAFRSASPPHLLAARPLRCAPAAAHERVQQSRATATLPAPASDLGQVADPRGPA